MYHLHRPDANLYFSQKIHSMLVYKFSTVYRPQANSQEGHTKFNAALRKFLNTHCFYSVDELQMICHIVILKYL